MSNYAKEYADLKRDPVRSEAFKASGENGTRIFPVLNSNIKTMKTVGEYIDTMYSQTVYNSLHKQKNRRVREFNFRSLDNHSDPKAITRSDIVMAAGRRFGGYDSAFVTLLLYVLLLDTGSGKSPSALRTEAFIRDLPVFIKRDLYACAKEIVASDALLTDNIYQEIVVLYGDQALYQGFLSHIRENYPGKDVITELFVREAAIAGSPIARRMHNFQRSALKKEALYAVIFYCLDQYVRKCRMRGLRTGRKIIRAEDFFTGFLDYFDDRFDGDLTWLGRVGPGEDTETLKRFILDQLSDDQRDELYICIQHAFCLQLP